MIYRGTKKKHTHEQLSCGGVFPANFPFAWKQDGSPSVNGPLALATMILCRVNPEVGLCGQELKFLVVRRLLGETFRLQRRRTKHKGFDAGRLDACSEVISQSTFFFAHNFFD